MRSSSVSSPSRSSGSSHLNAASLIWALFGWLFCVFSATWVIARLLGSPPRPSLGARLASGKRRGNVTDQMAALIAWMLVVRVGDLVKDGAKRRRLRRSSILDKITNTNRVLSMRSRPLSGPLKVYGAERQALTRLVYS